MEKFINAIRTAQELDIGFWSGMTIIPQYLAPDKWGKAKREKILKSLKNGYTIAIMNSRDARVRMQRDLSALLDLELWEPEKFTDEHAELTQDLRDAIEACKEWEEKCAKAKTELKEVQA